jgi:hypothetical protein
VRPKPSSVDVVVVNDVALLSAGPAEGLATLRRALVPGGIMVVAGLGAGHRSPPWYRELVADDEGARSYGFAEVAGWTLAPLGSAPSEVVIADDRSDAEQGASWLFVTLGAEPEESAAVELVLRGMPASPRAKGPEDVSAAQAEAIKVARAEADSLKERLKLLGTQHADKLGQVQQMSTEAVSKAEQALEDSEARFTALEEALEEARSAKPGPANEHAGESERDDADYIALEAKLQSRAERLRELEAELEHSNRLVRDLLEEMERRAHAPSEEESAPPEEPAEEPEPSADAPLEEPSEPQRFPEAERQVAAARNELLEVRSLLAGALMETSFGEVRDPFGGVATVVGMEAPSEWDSAPPAGIQELRARLEWVRSEQTVGGAESEAETHDGVVPDGPIQLGSLPPAGSTNAPPPGYGEVRQEEAIDDELVRLHQRLAELDEEVESERHRRESLEVEVQRLEGTDSLESLRELKARLEALSLDAASMSTSGEAPEMQRLADLLRDLADR